VNIELFPCSGGMSEGHRRAGWSQIGQAMPPPLAHAVAGAVAEQLRAARAKGAAGLDARAGVRARKARQ
jgi:site-specific DNA-cytosine methylase